MFHVQRTGDPPGWRSRTFSWKWSSKWYIPNPQEPQKYDITWVIREYYEIVWHSESQKWYIPKTNQKSAFIEIVWNSEVSGGHGPRYVARPRSCPSSAPGSPVAACFDAMDIAWKRAVVIHDDPTNLQHLQKVTQCDPWNPQPKLTSLENAGQCPKTFGSQSQSVPDIPPFEVKRPLMSLGTQAACVGLSPDLAKMGPY